MENLGLFTSLAPSRPPSQRERTERRGDNLWIPLLVRPVLDIIHTKDFRDMQLNLVVLERAKIIRRPYSTLQTFSESWNVITKSQFLCHVFGASFARKERSEAAESRFKLNRGFNIIVQSRGFARNHRWAPTTEEKNLLKFITYKSLGVESEYF